MADLRTLQYNSENFATGSIDPIGYLPLSSILSLELRWLVEHDVISHSGIFINITFMGRFDTIRRLYVAPALRLS